MLWRRFCNFFVGPRDTKAQPNPLRRCYNMEHIRVTDLPLVRTGSLSGDEKYSNLFGLTR